MSDESAQNLAWNAYIEKHGAEPSTAQQFLSFTRNKSNKVASFTFVTARQVLAKNKGKGKLALSTEMTEHKQTVHELQVTPDQIDSFLDEIEQNEKKDHSSQPTEDSNVFDWSNILNGNIGKNIRAQIGSGEIDINSQNPDNGMTLLHYAVVLGSLPLVKTVCNFGADVHIKDHDGHDALKYAIQYGRYKITELIYYRQLQGSVGTDLKDIAMRIHQKNKEAEFMRDHGFKSSDFNEFMIKAVEQRAPFGEDMLFYSWYFVLNGHRQTDTNNDHYNRGLILINANQKEEPLESKLFKTMMKTYEDILRNTDDTEGWKWLKTSFINSLIWYLPHPVHAKEDGKEDDEIDAAEVSVDGILKKTMFYELLVRVREESKRQSDLLLKEKINKIKEERLSEWQRLISYNIDTQYAKIARQDLCGCLVPKYNETDLSEDIYPPSTHFSAKKHYDTNIYLNELMFRGNILDHLFQKSIKQITMEINAQTGDSVHYTAGPVKTLARSQTKVENNYINEDYPTAAKILDINRCALHFKNIESMMRFIALLTSKIQGGEAYCLVKIIRCKNGWSVYDEELPQYTDIKLNVLVQSNVNAKQQIIAEIQFLLDLMSDFKKKSHKLYSIDRKQELVFNFGRLTFEMRQFDDILNLNDIFISVIDADNLKFFKHLLTLYPTVDALIDAASLDPKCSNTALFHIIKRENSAIYRYLTIECLALYRQTMLNYVTKYLEKYQYDTFFHQIVLEEDPQLVLPRILHQMIELFRDDRMNLKKFLFAKESQSFLNGLNCREYSAAFELILTTPLIDDAMKFELLFDRHNGFSEAFKTSFSEYCADNMGVILRYICKDRELLLRALRTRFWDSGKMTMMMGICNSRDPMSTDALRFVLNNKLLSEQEKYDLFRQRMEGEENYRVSDDTTTHVAFKSWLGDNAVLILDYFCAINRKGLIELLVMQKEDGGDTPLMLVEKEIVLLRVFHYFGHSRHELLHIISAKKNKKGRSVFSRMMMNETHCNVLRCILACDALTAKDKFELCGATDNDGLSPLMYGSDVCIVAILQHFCDDRASTLKLLSMRSNKEKKTPLMFIHAVKKKTLEFVLNNGALLEDDKFSLCAQTDAEGRGVLYHAFKWARDSYFDEDHVPLHIAMIWHFVGGDKEYLGKLLLQQTSAEGETCLMAAANKARVVVSVLKRLQSIGGNKMMSQFLNCKNKKDETLLTVAIRLTTNANLNFHTNAIKEWLDYLRFDEALDDEAANDDTLFAFLEEKKNNKPKVNQRRDVPKCICGAPMRMTFPAGLGRNAGNAMCARCQQMQRNSMYFCQNNRNFVVNGRMNRHQGPYIVCMQCFGRETQQKQAALAQKEALKKTKNEFETNPFVTACAFGAEETIKKCVDRITNTKKLLLSKESNEKRRNTAMHVLCANGTPSLLRFLCLNNAKLSTQDKFELIGEENKFGHTPLTGANAACGIQIIEYFNKTDEMRKLLLQMVSSTDLLFKCKDDSVRFEVLKCIENDGDVLRECLNREESGGSRKNLKLFGALCESKMNPVSSIRLILHSKVLDDRFKLALFDNVYGACPTNFFDLNSQYKPFWAACCNNPQIVFEILNYYRNDGRVTMQLLSQIMFEKETPLMRLCQSNSVAAAKVIELILDSEVMTQQDKLALFVDRATPDKQRNALNYACANNECPQIAISIFDYFDKESLTQLIVSSHKLLFDAKNNENQDILRRILRVINDLGATKRWNLLSDVADSETKRTFVFTSNAFFDLRRTLFCCIDDAKMVTKLLECKNNLFDTAKSYQKDAFVRAPAQVNLKQNVRSIESHQNGTDPFITACYLGKQDVITKFASFNHCDVHKNNCLMILAQYEYYTVLCNICDAIAVEEEEEVLVKLLRNQNMIDGQHLLLILCKKKKRTDIAAKILQKIADNEAKLSLIHLKDFYNESCVDYADADTLLNVKIDK